MTSGLHSSARRSPRSNSTRPANHVPLWILVAVQGFRLPLELAMHRLYERGIMPEQMSYSGRNFDIVTGATALGRLTLVVRAMSDFGEVESAEDSRANQAIRLTSPFWTSSGPAVPQ